MKKSRYKRVKVGQLPGDLPPQEYKDFPGTKDIIKRKTRRQLAEEAEREVENAILDTCRDNCRE